MRKPAVRECCYHLATDMIDVEPAKKANREYRKRGLGTMKPAIKHLDRRSIEADGSDLEDLVALS